MLMKLIREAVNKGRDMLDSQIGSKLIYKSNKIPNKIPGIFIDLDEIILKFMWKDRGTR